MDLKIYSTKKGSELAIMRHGNAGWRESSKGNREELVYIQPLDAGLDEKNWLPVEDHRRFNIQPRKILGELYERSYELRMAFLGRRKRRPCSHLL